ncbi:MAG: OmpA family protein [Nitrospirae bacterium]|nr:OmpA family protein [Nitrospirota bacterium]
MRKFFVSLSILFFTLSGIITVKALVMPVRNTHYQNNPEGLRAKDISHESTDISEQASQKEAANPVLIEGSQVTNERSGEKLPNTNEETPMKAETEGTENKARVLAVVGGGMFSAGQDVINENLITSVKGLVREIAASPDNRVIIQGHTDNLPIKSNTGKRYMDNMELSILRAKAVSQILVDNGISIERISVAGYGDTQPIATNDTDEGRAKNRRVEIKLISENKEF